MVPEKNVGFSGDLLERASRFDKTPDVAGNLSATGAFSNVAFSMRALVSCAFVSVLLWGTPIVFSDSLPTAIHAADESVHMPLLMKNSMAAPPLVWMIAADPTKTPTVSPTATLITTAPPSSPTATQSIRIVETATEVWPPRATPTPPPTPTRRPTHTPKPDRSVTPTSTAIPTSTATSTPTSTTTPTPSTAPSTPSATATPTATAMRASPTPTVTLIPTAAPTTPPSATPTVRPTIVPPTIVPTATSTRDARLDSDFDGIGDRIECRNPISCPDNDGDGFPNYRDIDSDNDGIPDRVEAVVFAVVGQEIRPVDLDGDHIPDYLDFDSDNDSLPDYFEGHDADLDGYPDIVADGIDDDGDGLDNAFDTIYSSHSIDNALGSNAPLPRAHGALPNWRNADDDGDGIPTIEEVGRNRLQPIDIDGNGQPDFLQPRIVLHLFLPVVLYITHYP